MGKHVDDAFRRKRSEVAGVVSANVGSAGNFVEIRLMSIRPKEDRTMGRSLVRNFLSIWHSSLDCDIILAVGSRPV